MKETETISQTPEQLLQVLDAQIAMKRSQNEAARRNRAVFLTVGILVIVMGTAAALLVLSQMVQDVPRAGAGIESSQ